jgi:NTE family protein
MKKKEFFLCILFLMYTYLSAQNNFYQNIPPKPKNRPSVALILAGGGARGFAHIAVLELLVQEKIPIDIVIGTSAGSIIGSLYCAGYTPAQIKKELAYLDWSAIFHDATTSPFENTLGDHSTSSTPFRINLAKDPLNTGLQLGTGLLTGQHAYELFKKLTLRIPSDKNFNELCIPFRAVTTDLLKGKTVVLSQGDLAEAVRASMSIPTVFQPFAIDENYYIDGMALDNTPIDVAVKMGYDIIIVSEISDTLETDYKKFEQQPLLTSQQMINMPQIEKNRKYYRYADLIIYPDYAGKSVIDYQNAVEIYNKSKQSVKEFRTPVKKIKEQIDTLSEPGRETTEVHKKTSYYDNPLPTPTKLIIHGVTEKDTEYIKKKFSQIAGKKLTPEFYTHFSQSIYQSGLYQQVVTRLTDNGTVLELYLRPQNRQKAVILFGGNYKFGIAADAQSSLSLFTDLQWRGLTGSGSVLALRTTFIDTLAAQLMFMQPMGSHFFTQVLCSYQDNKNTITSGWKHYSITAGSLRQAAVQARLGIPFLTYNTFLSGAGIRWYDTTEIMDTGARGVNGDFFTGYLSSNVDHAIFPASGSSLSIKGTGILPIDKHDTQPIMDIVQIEALGAIPVNKNLSIVMSCFAGSNLSQTLNKLPGLQPVYAFSLADSRYFPQITDSAVYGIHKAVISAGIRFTPAGNLTLIGGKAIFSISGAAGNIWSSYQTISLKNLCWRASVDAGIRITEGSGLLLRLGAGKTRNYILPFISFEFGNIRY